MSPHPAGRRLSPRAGQGWLPEASLPGVWTAIIPQSTRVSLRVCLCPHLFLQGPQSCGIRATLVTQCHHPPS